MELKVLENDDCVSLGCEGIDEYFDAFLDVYIDSELSPSPFKSIDDARLFVEIIKTILERVYDIKRH